MRRPAPAGREPRRQRRVRDHSIGDGGARGRPLHRRDGAAAGWPTSRRRARERPLPGRRAQSLGQRAVPRAEAARWRSSSRRPSWTSGRATLDEARISRSCAGARRRGARADRGTPVSGRRRDRAPRSPAPTSPSTARWPTSRRASASSSTSRRSISSTPRDDFWQHRTAPGVLVSAARRRSRRHHRPARRTYR